MLIFYKDIDQSVLNAGLSIPVIYQEQMLSEIGLDLKRGQKKTITILLDGISYSAVLTNILFDEKKYPDRRDILQIRYGKKSALAQKLRDTFIYTSDLLEQRFAEIGNRRLSGLEEQEKEFLAIYSTVKKGTLLFDCIRNTEFREETSLLTHLPESVAEGILDGTDETAGILLQTKLCKIRKLTRAIGDDLKKAYGYRCQICGEYIGERYGSQLIHAHHIDYFTKSLNNNADNIMIVCPNHHGVIHDRNPVFDRRSKTFFYPNGYREGLKLNKHL